MSDHLKVSVDGVEVEVEPGTSICRLVKKPALKFRAFAITNACRLPAIAACVWSKSMHRKPVASCAMPVAPDMVGLTKSDLVKTARKGVMEFLLINHPLDCPICDQGGEVRFAGSGLWLWP